MTLTLHRTFFGLVLSALTTHLAVAVPLTDWTNHVLGTYTPASGYNNDADVTVAANKLITWYNGGANPNPDVNAVFALTPGDSVPFPPLPGPAVFGFKDDTAPFSSVNPSIYDYVLGKYGNTAYLFYIGNVDPGDYNLPVNLFGEQNALSHVVAFTTGGTSVPDGGTTIAPLGTCLLLLENLRRKLRRT